MGLCRNVPQDEGEEFHAMGASCERDVGMCKTLRVRCCEPWDRHVRGLCRNVI